MTDEKYRKLVLWLGPPPSAAVEAAFFSRNMPLKMTDTPELSDLLVSRCAIFIVPKKSRSRTNKLLRETIPKLIMHGVGIILFPPDESVGRQLQFSINDPLQNATTMSRIRFEKEDSAQLLSETSIAESLAEKAREITPGPGASLGLSYTTQDGSILSEECELLLRRAFFDMNSVHLRPLSGGKSGAFVYQANAVRAAEGDSPLPFFVKFDKVEFVKKELNAYRELVIGSVPFNQRPNLELDRCLLGWQAGLLVGDFVEASVPLAEIAFRPEGRNVIYSLFEDALRGWRRQSYQRGQVNNQTVLGHLPLTIRPKDIPAAVVAEAQRRGLASTTDNLYDKLQEQAAGHNFPVGKVHGDLHAGNVMVRLGEAILIDFSYAQDNCALFADVVSLEIGLTFTTAAESVANGTDKVHQEKGSHWLTEVNELYQLDRMRRVPPVIVQENDFSWLRDRVRQLRALAALCDATERAYACGVVAYLLRRARFGGNKGENVVIAAVALVQAEKLLFEMEGGAL